MNCHVMAGLPDWAYWSAVSAAFLFTVVMTLRPRIAAPSGWRFDLLSLAPIRALVMKRSFQTTLQIPLVLILGLILYAGFFGSPVPERNAATILTWTIWWTLLIVDIVLLGRMWCLVCPWEALAAWLRRLAFWRRTDEPLALDLPWPKMLRNVYPATVLFVGLTWLELGWGVTMSPRGTAVLGLLMVLMAVIPALIFERRSFCRYGCLIGRICGLYGMVAPVEVRARDKDVCRDCESKACLQGSENAYPCPTGQYLGAMEQNTYCTVCTECVKSCPHENVAINLRPWGTDFHTLRRPKKDEAILALVLLSLTSFHGLTMTPLWGELITELRNLTGMSFLGTFSAGMAGILVVPAVLYMAFIVVFARASRPPRLAIVEPKRLSNLAARYAYALIPIALMYHLAHNAGHFLTEAGKLIPVLSDPLGHSAASVAVLPLAPLEVVWALGISLVLLGLVWSLRVLARTHAPNTPLRARLVISAFVLSLSLANLWLLAQPMEMRTGM